MSRCRGIACGMVRLNRPPAALPKDTMSTLCLLPITTYRLARHARLGCWFVWVALALGGCTSSSVPREAVFFRGDALAGVPDATAAQATLKEAQRLDRDGQERAVDLYYQAAVQAEPGLEQCGAAQASPRDKGRRSIGRLWPA